MDAIYSAPNGFSARQTKNNDPTLPTLTYRWWFDGTARLEIPLNKFTPAELAKSEKYRHAKRFLGIARQSKFEHATVVDYSYLLSAACALANIHLTLCELHDDKRDIYSSFILKNIAFTSPYLDTEKFLHGLEQFSLPLTTDDEVRQPKEPSQSNMFHHAFPNVAETTDELHTQAKPFIFMAPIISWILHSVGATQEVGDWTNDEEMWAFLNAN